MDMEERRALAEMARRYDDLPDATLYDIFFETGTVLGGWLVALEREARARGDEALAKKWREEDLAMDEERWAVSAKDREAQIACIEKWGKRRRELDKYFEDKRSSDGDD